MNIYTGDSCLIILLSPAWIIAISALCIQGKWCASGYCGRLSKLPRCVQFLTWQPGNLLRGETLYKV